MARKKTTTKKKKAAPRARKPTYNMLRRLGGEGQEAIEQGRHADALAAGEQLVLHEPARADSWAIRGLGRRRTGDLEGALADLDQAEELDPTSAGVLDARSQLLFDLQRWGAARDALRRYLEVDPLEVDFAHLRLWLARTALKEPGADRELAAEVTRLAKKAEAAWWLKVAAHLLGTLSLDDLWAAATTPELRCEAGFFAGALLLIRGDREGARTCFQRSVAEQIGHFTEHHSAATLLAALG